MILRPRGQKVLADLWGNRTRSLLVVASITVGLFAIGVIATIYAVITHDMRSAYLEVNPANIYIQTSLLIDQAMLDSLTTIDQVDQVAGARTFDLRVTNRMGEWKSINLHSYTNPETIDINRLRLISGIWPPKEGEIVIDQHKMGDLGVPLGGMVKIERPSEKVRELKLVGVVQDLTVGAFSGGGGFFNASFQGYISKETLDLLEQSNPDQFSGVYITVKNKKSSEAEIRKVASDVVTKLEANGVPVASNTIRLPGDHPNSYLVNAISGILLLLGLLVLFLSGFLITNTLQALLNQQVEQIGIMKTIGARRIQVAGVYIFLLLGFGTLAYCAAAPLSYGVSFILLRLLAGQLNFFLEGERIIWPVAIGQAVLAVGMPLLAAWLPIWSGTRISVREALSGTLKINASRKKLSSENQGVTTVRKTHAHNRGLLHRSNLLTRPLLISLRNTFRRKGRLALTLTTLTLGGAVFISTFNVQISINKYIDQIGQYFLSDVSVSLDQPARLSEIEEILSNVPGVGRIEGWASARAELIQEDGTTGDRVHLLAPPADSQLVKPVLMQGRWIEPSDENAITLNEVFAARFPQLKVGDTIRIRVNGEDTSWTVVGFYRYAGKSGGFSAYTGYDYLTRLTNQSNKAAMIQVVSSKPRLSAQEQDQLSSVVSKRLKDAGFQVTDLTTGSYLRKIAGGGFSVLIAFLLFLAVLTALVGSIGLAGTMSMNVMERTREIGVMRAIGASDKILMRMVLTEGLLIGAISYFLGAVLSFPISKLMADGISRAIFDSPSDFGFTLTGFLIWLVIVVILSSLASVIPARSATRLTIREVLAYE